MDHNQQEQNEKQRRCGRWYTSESATTPEGSEQVRRVIRPQFRAMLKNLDDGQAQVMVAYDLERAVRDLSDLEDLID